MQALSVVADVTLVAAAYDSQTAQEDTSGNVEGGAFTKAFRNALARAGWDLTLNELLQEVRQLDVNARALTHGLGAQFVLHGACSARTRR